MNDKINFRKLKVMIKAGGFSVAKFAEKLGEAPTGISAIYNSRRIPKTDLVAKICSILKCYPSDIVTFKDIDVDENAFSNKNRIPLPEVFSGDVSYKPLFMLLVDYREEHDGMTEKDFFDKIEPPRRLRGQTDHNTENIKKAVAAKYGEGYVAKRGNRTDYSKGLNPATRTKLRKDRPLNLSVIYEICKHLGCSIDFVLSYK